MRTPQRVSSGAWHNEHPPVDTLRAYQKGELPPEEVERLQDHFVFCTACTETMLDLAAFFSEDPAPGRQDPEKLLEAWDELVKNLEPEGR